MKSKTHKNNNLQNNNSNHLRTGTIDIIIIWILKIDTATSCIFVKQTILICTLHIIFPVGLVWFSLTYLQNAV